MIVLCYGLPGTGKSTWLHDYVAQQSTTHCFFINDHEAGWGEDGIHWRGKPPQLTIIENREQLEELQAIPAQEFPETGAYVFRGFEGGEIAGLAVAKGNITYVDDEIDTLARRKGWETSPLRAIVHTGRHCMNEDGVPCELHIAGACRRPQNLHTDLTDLVDQVCVFRIQGKNTLKRLENDAVLEDSAQWEVVRKLPNFHFMHWPSMTFLKTAPVGGKEAKT